MPEESSLLNSLDLPDGIKGLSYSDLERIANEIRELIIDVTSKNGGHIAPSLGVVELTLALLKVFDLPKDKIIWDVSHQAYAYKILTGRLKDFHTLRQYGGISGFSRPEESIYDTTIAGHASTSISSAVGITLANDILGNDGKAVAVIGDGALTGGVALEALNNIGEYKKNIIIVLNDNEMSISENVGGFSAYLSKSLTGAIATKIRYDLKSAAGGKPFGGALLKIAKKMEKMMITAVSPGSFFENLGIRYIGPIDGHNIKEVEKALTNAKLQKRPVLVHVATKKGKGYEHAENKPDIFHGVPSFNKETGISLGKSSNLSWTEVFSNKICEIAEKHNNVAAITAAMKDGTGLKNFAEKFPDRFFDVGIAEQYALAFASGLATANMKPYCAIYSTFLQRAYDQIIHDIAIAGLPVTICIDRGGFVGADGSTHHGIYDMSYLSLIPHITVMLPKDKYELESMLDLSYELNCPVAIRYARGNVYDNPSLEKNKIEIGKVEVVKNGGSIAVISIGHIFEEVYNAYNMLLNDNIEVTLINLRFLKPLDSKYLCDLLKDKSMVVTVEEGSLLGGAGQMITALVNNNGLNIKCRNIGIEDKFFEHGTVAELRKDAGIDSVSIYNKIKNYIENIKS